MLALAVVAATKCGVDPAALLICGCTAVPPHGEAVPPALCPPASAHRLPRDALPALPGLPACLPPFLPAAGRMDQQLLAALRWLSLAAGGEAKQVQVMAALQWATQLVQVGCPLPAACGGCAWHGTATSSSACPLACPRDRQPACTAGASTLAC